jgi:crotonobetainyl-CoA:carnitine CoA-transferase CaiB-like acyl-CoA transferase
MRFSKTPAARNWAGPVLGDSTQVALLDAGYSAEEIEALLAQGAAAAAR